MGVQLGFIVIARECGCPEDLLDAVWEIMRNTALPDKPSEVYAQIRETIAMVQSVQASPGLQRANARLAVPQNGPAELNQSDPSEDVMDLLGPPIQSLMPEILAEKKTP